ncbi:ABC transporter G family member 20-like [Tribolium madens]|uniref:ABC transporter G family member 20-like n=1 Tax=Tribolium madens TaxID=41895 RepID=UPI001CF740C8|nr:ABC transporter G family member 20-like [Tribolium madens]
MAAKDAVYVQDACKSYGKKEVLKNLRMKVPRGCIYGLLGPSGCGKTTLLSCIVGRRNLNSGDIWVLGGKPGTVDSGVPGPKIGYMPQDIALVGEFTVKDAIFYFGRIFDMPEKMLEERFNELSGLLDLPPEDRFIRNCSGGQQRRVSFAASMVHLPELLILDEPTVGVDPILRERIWDYLVEITSKSNTAVIITTHYIEEARQANMIGLMRGGCLIAEESPATLLTMFQTEVLEDVFFILSKKQSEGRLEDTMAVARSNLQIQNSNTDISVASFDTTRGSTDILTKEKQTKSKNKSGYELNGKRIKSLLDKNWKQFYRNVSGMIFIFMFPIAQNVAFLLAVGPDPRGVNLAVVNEESFATLCPNFNFSQSAMPYDDYNCHFYNMSCRFLSYIDTPMITKVKYDELPHALEDARHGKVVGVMYMAENFTESFEARIEDGRNVEAEVLSFSEIKVWLDMSNRQIGATVKYKLLTIFKDFQKDLLRDCNYEPKMADFMNMTTFYGKDGDTFTEYMTPGLVLTIMFFLMTLMTSQIIVTDRSEGLWDRSIIAGVSSLEISLTHFIFQIGIVLIYTVITLTITFAIFKIPNIGSMWIITLITFFQGLTGVGFGFWISIISENVTMANVLTTGSFYIMILLSGLMWPLEGMPVVLQWLSKCLPFTIAIDSFRNVMKKGWSFDYFEVWNGFGIEVTWIVIFGVVNTMLVQSKR